MLNNNDIDIIGLSETRLDETVRDSDVNINGYNIYRNDRNANGGGVAIYVKESLPEPTVKIKSDKLELVALEFTSDHTKPFLVMCWYRPPAKGVDDESFENLTDILRAVDKKEKEIILRVTPTVTLKQSKSKCQETQNDLFRVSVRAINK